MFNRIHLALILLVILVALVTSVSAQELVTNTPEAAVVSVAAKLPLVAQELPVPTVPLEEIVRAVIVALMAILAPLLTHPGLMMIARALRALAARVPFEWVQKITFETWNLVVALGVAIGTAASFYFGFMDTWGRVLEVLIFLAGIVVAGTLTIRATKLYYRYVARGVPLFGLKAEE